MPKSELFEQISQFFAKLLPFSEPTPPNGPDAPPVPLVEPELAKYRDDPVGFATDVLGVILTNEQVLIAQAVALGKRVKIESGHNTGKSFLMACIALWWFYTRNPSVIICNAPTSRAVEDILWVEIRLLHMRAVRPLQDFFVGPKAPEMYDTPDHWAKGYTTSKGEAYTGRHRTAMLFLFDEDEGIDAIFWTTTNTMFQPDGTHAWVAACNPITTSSQSYLESTATGPDGNSKWELFTLSSLNHPNIPAQLRGDPPVIPNAVSLDQVEQWVRDWTTPLDDPTDRQETDVEWPPGSNQWKRPGPTFKARAQGKRPTEGIDTIWSVATWKLAITPKWEPRQCWTRAFGITMGLDAAGYGDDDAALHVRTGPLSLHHEAHNGWEPGQWAERIKKLSREWCYWYNSLADNNRPQLRPTDIPCVIEFDGGYGIGAHSHRGEFDKWIGVTVGSKSDKFDVNGKLMYANVRSEIWCESATLARRGLVDLSRLDPDILERLRKQLLAPTYENKPDGAKQVEPKKDTKERIGRSPDDADSFILSHYTPADWGPVVVTKREEMEF